jgi:Ala-tRNA(Pro) deacylase
MAMSITLREYLEREGVEYKLLQHPYTSTSMETAEESHVPGDQLAKGVVLEDENGYLVAVVPATHRVELTELQQQLKRHLSLATEHELGDLFDDCEIGAVPPLGEAYGYEVIVDDSLVNASDVYFEAGDHTDIVHVSGDDFRDLMTNVRHGHFSRHI